MKCIVIGLGNFGIALAQRFTSMGHEVIGVDADIDKVNEYKDTIKNTICLNITNEQSVKVLPLQDADMVFVAIGKELGASVLVVAILKQLAVKRIIARSLSKLHETILKAMGISEIISPESSFADYFAAKVEFSSTIYTYIVNDNYVINETKVPTVFVGQRLENVKLEKDFSLRLIAVKHFTTGKKYEFIEKPMNDFIFGEADILVLFGKQENFRTLPE